MGPVASRALHWRNGITQPERGPRSSWLVVIYEDKDCLTHENKWSTQRSRVGHCHPNKSHVQYLIPRLGDPGRASQRPSREKGGVRVILSIETG